MRPLLVLSLAWTLAAAPNSGTDGSAPTGNRPDRKAPGIAALVTAPDGSGWLRGSQAGVVFRPSQEARERAIPTGLDHVHALAFSPDGSTLAIAGGTPGESGTVELRSWPAGDLLGLLEEHEDVVYDAAWLDGGKALATAGADQFVRIWDTQTRREVVALKGHSGPVLALAGSPDGKWLCSGGANGTIRVWENGPWRQARTLTNHLGPVYALAFRPAQQGGRPATLASAGGDGTARVWQPATGRMVRIVRHPAAVLCVAWDRDGEHLVTGAKDGRVRVVDGDGDAILADRQLSGDWITSLAVPPDGLSPLAGDSGGTVHVWDDGSRYRSRSPMNHVIPSTIITVPTGCQIVDPRMNRDDSPARNRDDTT